MDEKVKNKVYNQFVDDTIKRLRLFAPLIAIGELVLMILDFQSGFFSEDKLNYINMAAEILLIVSSILVFFVSRLLIKNTDAKMGYKVTLIVAFRIIIMLSVLMFIFTDIYVRHKELGPYIVFLFVLQLTPAYRARTNWIQFIVIGIMTAGTYIAFVSSNSNTIFTTIVIFFCFAITTEFLRNYFTKQLENSNLAEYNYEKYRKLSKQTISALAGAVEAKDMYTKGHSQRVAEYSTAIAEKMGYDEDKLKEVSFIALMHDVGKIGVSDAVINKTDKLTDEEYTEIKKHPEIGFEILRQITELPGISEGARWHHERYDGRGYPDGLKGESTPEIARIIAVADAYDAMTSNRSYRKSMSQDAVRMQIAENVGTQFDPHIAEIMLQLIDEDTDYTMHE